MQAESSSVTHSQIIIAGSKPTYKVAVSISAPPKFCSAPRPEHPSAPANPGEEPPYCSTEQARKCMARGGASSRPDAWAHPGGHQWKMPVAIRLIKFPVWPLMSRSASQEWRACVTQCDMPAMTHAGHVSRRVSDHTGLQNAQRRLRNLDWGRYLFRTSTKCTGRVHCSSARAGSKVRPGETAGLRQLPSTGQDTLLPLTPAFGLRAPTTERIPSDGWMLVLFAASGTV